MLDGLANHYRDMIRQVEGAGRRVGDWLGGDTGQAILATADYFALGSEAGRFFRRTGWYLPLQADLRGYAIESQRYHVPFDARKAARLVGPASAHWELVTDGLRASDALATRLPVVEDGLCCIEGRQWHAAVCTLMPVIEGVISDEAAIFSDVRVGRRFEELLDKTTGPLDAICAVDALAALDGEFFSRRDFSAQVVQAPDLNRHLILHGRSAGYGTEINAIRTLMQLVALSELVDGPFIMKLGGGDGLRPFLEEYGQLAPFRRQLRERTLVLGDDRPS